MLPKLLQCADCKSFHVVDANDCNRPIASLRESAPLMQPDNHPLSTYITCAKCGLSSCHCDPWHKTVNVRLANSVEAKVSAPLAITDDTLQRAKQIIGSTPVRAAGYRLKVLLIESDKGLSAGEAEKAPTLKKLGFEAKSDDQKAREDRGTDNALIVDVGPAAWCQQQHLGPDPWAKVGMVIKMIRYTGHAYEEPPGSGKRYALINDEDVLGYYEETV